jgi:ornithine cyclodeaminase
VKFFGPEAVAAALPWDELIMAIEDIVVDEQAVAPERTVHGLGGDAALLMKPGWVVGDVIAVKVVSFFPDNGVLELPTINAGVLLFDGTNGTCLGACDGNELTTRRTAAASAVAAKRLARTDARRLLVIGTGALSPMTAQAHAAVRDFEQIEIWGRSTFKAIRVVEELKDAGYTATVAADLDESVAAADVITCVTGSTTPIVRGELLSPGTHVDLIGSFTPAMRETDDDVIRRASVWVDTRTDGILAGDIAQPLASGLLSMDDIRGDLRELVSGASIGRRDDDEITLFKSAGIALEDVAAAKLVFGS